MIDERAEVRGYLEGRGIVKENLYRICTLLALWYREQGCSKLEIREAIFAWANLHSVYLRFNLNALIDKALAERPALREAPVVHVSRADIREIDRRVDHPKTKYVALALLCYAKAYGDGGGRFSVSTVALGGWLGLPGSNLSRKYIPELVDFEYLVLISTPRNNYHWDRTEQAHASSYQLCVPLENTGEWVLRENEIRSLYAQIYPHKI